MVLPPNLATFGETDREAHRAADLPAQPIVTLSESSSDELIDELNFKPSRVSRSCRRASIRASRRADEREVRPPRSSSPSAGWCRSSASTADRGDGRGAPHAIPTVELTIVGDGAERENLEALVARPRRGRLGLAAGPALRRRARRALPPGVGARQRVGRRGLGHDAHRGGRVRHARGRHRIAGHRDAVRPGVTGLLVDRHARARPRHRATARRPRHTRPAAGRRPRTSRRAHVGGDGHRHPRRARRRSDGGRPEPSDGARDRTESAPPRWRGRAQHLAPRARRATSRCCSPTAARSAPTPRRTSTSTPAACSRGAVHVGPEHRDRHGHPPEHRLPVPDGAVLLADADQLGFPDWVAQRLWLGSILFAAGAGVLFLLRTWAGRPATRRAAGWSSPPRPTCSRRTSSTTRRASR